MVGEALLVLQRHFITVVFIAFAVIRQPFSIHAALIIGLQIAKFAADGHATVCHQMWCHRGIVIWSQIEIIRCFQFKAIRARFDRGQQQTAFAIAIEGKVHPRCVK